MQILISLRVFDRRVGSFLLRVEEHVVVLLYLVLCIGWTLLRIGALYGVGLLAFFLPAWYFSNPYWLVGALLWFIVITIAGLSYGKKFSRRAQEIDFGDAAKISPSSARYLTIRYGLRATCVVTAASLTFLCFHSLSVRRDRERDMAHSAFVRGAIESALKETFPVVINLGLYYYDHKKFPGYTELTTDPLFTWQPADAGSKVALFQNGAVSITLTRKSLEGLSFDLEPVEPLGAEGVLEWKCTSSTVPAKFFPEAWEWKIELPGGDGVSVMVRCDLGVEARTGAPNSGPQSDT